MSEANIGPSGEHLRRTAGWTALTVSAMLLIVSALVNTPPWWRLGTFPLVWFGMLGVLQARARTCVALAARRTCEPEVGPLTAAEADTLARRGRSILLRATIAAALITLIALMLPGYRWSANF